MNAFSVEINSLFYLLLLSAMTVNFLSYRGKHAWTILVCAGIVGIDVFSQYFKLHFVWYMNLWIPVGYAIVWVLVGIYKHSTRPTGETEQDAA